MSEIDVTTPLTPELYNAILEKNASLRQQLTEAQRWNKEYSEMLTTRDGTIEALTARLAACEKLTTMQDGGIRDLHTQIATLTDQLAACEGERDKLNGAIIQP